MRCFCFLATCDQHMHLGYSKHVLQIRGSIDEDLMYSGRQKMKPLQSRRLSDDVFFYRSEIMAQLLGTAGSIGFESQNRYNFWEICQFSHVWRDGSWLRFLSWQVSLGLSENWPSQNPTWARGSPPVTWVPKMKESTEYEKAWKSSVGFAPSIAFFKHSNQWSMALTNPPTACDALSHIRSHGYNVPSGKLT